MKNPPVLIAVLGFFAALAGFDFLFFGLRALGFDWFGALGDLPPLENVGIWGWLAVGTGIFWILVAVGLWGLQPWARIIALVIAAVALLEAVLAFFQFPGTGIGFAMAVMPALILWYLMSREVRLAFGEGEPSAAVAPPAAAASTPPAAAAAVAAAAASPAVAAEPAPGAAAAVAAAAPGPPATSVAPEPAEAPGAAYQMRVDEVEGIGPANAEKLAAVGIGTTADLLAAGAKPHDRERIAATTGISAKLIRDWVDKVDLMRVPGVGPQYSDLLEAAGVGSPAELAQRNPANLAVTVQEVVAARPGIVRRIPSEAEITAWIVEAGTLETAVEH
jgi:predicted flap endonuclease-1-like 5' DNA nuclease